MSLDLDLRRNAKAFDLRRPDTDQVRWPSDGCRRPGGVFSPFGGSRFAFKKGRDGA